MTGSPNLEGGSQDFLEETFTRAELLSLLDEEALSARQLENHLRMSRSTVHRATESLRELGLLEKRRDVYELTGLGTVVAGELSRFSSRVETACKLEPFLNTVDQSAVDVPLEHLADAEVTRSRHRQAHLGVKRIIELLEQSDSARILSSILSPLYVEVAHREMLDGMEIEVIFDEAIIDLVTTRYVDRAADALETGRFDVLVGSDVPFELFLFDDRMGMAAHDEDAIARAFVESESQAARRWAERTYESYAEDATRPDLGF